MAKEINPLKSFMTLKDAHAIKDRYAGVNKPFSRMDAPLQMTD